MLLLDVRAQRPFEYRRVRHRLGRRRRRWRRRALLLLHAWEKRLVEVVRWQDRRLPGRSLTRRVRGREVSGSLTRWGHARVHSRWHHLLLKTKDFFINTIPPLWLLVGSPILTDPHPSRQHEGLQHAVWRLQQEVTRPQGKRFCASKTEQYFCGSMFVTRP